MVDEAYRNPDTCFGCFYLFKNAGSQGMEGSLDMGRVGGTPVPDVGYELTSMQKIPETAARWNFLMQFLMCLVGQMFNPNITMQMKRLGLVVSPHRAVGLWQSKAVLVLQGYNS